MVLKIDVSILRVKVKALYLWWCLLYFGMHHIPGKETLKHYFIDISRIFVLLICIFLKGK